MFDVLIIGGGVAGMSCALVLGSAQHKPFATGKTIGVIAHQKASNLQEAVFYNAYGIPPGTTGRKLLDSSREHLANQYPHVQQINNEKVLRIEGDAPQFRVITNKNEYIAAAIVLATNASNPFSIGGLEAYVRPHGKMHPDKNRLQLENVDGLVKDGLYVAGTLAGTRSQLAIAAGSGAAVATDILTMWNNGVPAHSHDKLSR